MGLEEGQRVALAALCDTFVPRVEGRDDPDGFWGRTATDLGVDQALEGALFQMDDAARTGLVALLDAFAAHGLVDASAAGREAIVAAVAGSSPEAAVGVGALSQLTLFLFYGRPDSAGRNPNWEHFGYPGPTSAPSAAPKAITPFVPSGDGETLEADVCVVGSGAGGSVIAGTLAAAGHRVVVLEAGGYYNEADFNSLELWAYDQLYWRGGPTPTADNNISLQAGTALGGGTVVNWTNCLRTRRWVREQWAREHGLDDVATPAFDDHLDAVLERIGGRDDCSDFNGPTSRMKEGAEELGYSFVPVVRNADAERYDPATAGYMGFGDRSGSKRSTDKTYLLDAYEAGATLVTRCRAERVLVEDGRAVGVEAGYTAEDGRRVAVTVRAPQVVVAGGALESPALLLRSGIGGPAVGDFLRLHPCTAAIGVYDTDQQAWWGAPHTGLVDAFADTGDGYGFLVEGSQYTTGLAGAAVSWTAGADHKELMGQFRNCSTFIGLTRDRGHGRVTVDPAGQAVVHYAVTDEVDQANLRQGLEVQIRLHAAAGASQIYSLAGGLPHWTRGDDLEAFISTAREAPLAAGGQRLFSAHQMGTCRMGADPATSVAGVEGQLHDVQGVWIGDGSAFPTASGTNPMLTIMALARRTAGMIAAGLDDRARGRSAEVRV